MNLKDKTILLIVPKFFGYEKDIERELILAGAVVDFIPDRPFNSAVMKAFTKCFPSITQLLVYAYYQITYPFVFAKKYDFVFIVAGITLSRRVLQNLRKTNPTTPFILYVWDSIQNRPHLYDNKHFYQKIFTFDPEDAKTFGFFFRPLFFARAFESHQNTPLKYDLSFVGTVHSDRFDIISRLLTHLNPRLKTYFFLYLHAYWFYLYNKLFRKSFRNTHKELFNFQPISKNEVATIIASSRAILDVEHHQQRGLTMRTFEVLGAKRKLVTTNASIQSYNFYHPANIFIIERSNPQIPETFFTSPYQEIPKAIYDKYSLRSWVEEIFK